MCAQGVAIRNEKEAREREMERVVVAKDVLETR